MAQKPQRLSQPSATFTYAHGARDAGRGKFKRSKLGSEVSAPERPESGVVRGGWPRRPRLVAANLTGTPTCTGASARTGPSACTGPSARTGASTSTGTPNPATLSTSGMASASSCP